MFFADDLHQSLLRLKPSNARGFVVGLSGGADSSALLAAMVAIRPRWSAAALRAVHVDHALQSDAAAFVLRCRRLCERFDVPLRVLNLQIGPHGGRSVEELAREARYEALSADLSEGEMLLTAHHEQDQAETFLLQALRGAGTAGLAAMPEVRRMGQGWHVRPLLHLSRSAVRDYLAAQDIAAAEDAMNADPRFDRAYLRQVLWPPLQARWPAAAAVLSRSATHIAASQVRCRDLARTDLAAVRDGLALSLSRLRHLSGARRSAVLRAYIESANARVPSTRRLAEAMRQMFEARADRTPAVHWAQHALRRYRDRIYLTASQIPVPAPGDWPWRAAPVYELGAGLGRLRLRAGRGGLDAARLPPLLRIRARGGGETLKIAAGAATRSVRHLFQEDGVVPWMREAIPYVFAADALLAIANLWSDVHYRAPPGEAGLYVVWEAAPPID